MKLVTASIHARLSRLRAALEAENVELYLSCDAEAGALLLEREGPRQVGHTSIGRALARLLDGGSSRDLPADLHARILPIGVLSPAIVARRLHCPDWSRIDPLLPQLCASLAQGYALGQLPHPPRAIAGDAPFAIDPAIADLVPDYVRERLRDLAAVRDLELAEAWTRMRMLGHRIKGSGGMYGFACLSALGSAALEAVHAHDAQALRLTFAAIEGYLQGLAHPRAPWRELDDTTQLRAAP